MNLLEELTRLLAQTKDRIEALNEEHGCEFPSNVSSEVLSLAQFTLALTLVIGHLENS